jgi:5'-3' exoribonuclease 1
MPSLDGLELIQGLLSGVHLGASALAGFPSMQTLPHTAQLGYHGVNVHMSDSKNPSMVITVENTYEGKKTESIAEELIGKKTFTGWPFLREGMVVGVSDDMFKFGQVALGGKKKVVSSPHSPMDVGNWKKKVDKIEHHYSKRFGVIIGQVDVLLHVRPLKGSSSSIPALSRSCSGQPQLTFLLLPSLFRRSQATRLWSVHQGV